MARQSPLLIGKVAAITGAARGIGKETARAFAREGMKVAIGDIDLELAEQTAAEIGPNTAAFRVDVTDRASFEPFVDAAEQRFGPLDVLVNNAGIMPVVPFLDEDDKTARRTVDINLHGVILGMKIALPRMMARDRGHIVNIASQAGKYGTPGAATYSATKHAVIGVTEAVRGELHVAGSPVELSYVMPYFVNTEAGVGTRNARGMKMLEPSDVADAVVDAVKRGVVEVWVPRSSRHMYRLAALLPRRATERVARALKGDRVYMDADQQARAAYELRAAGAEEPQLPDGDKHRQLTS